MSEISSGLIESLKQLSGVTDLYLSKREQHRTSLRSKAQLDLRRSDGETILVSVIDVSDSGVGFLCRKQLDMNEKIGLRMALQDGSEFESFVVRRGTGTVGGYKIGAVASEF